MKEKQKVYENLNPQIPEREFYFGNFVIVAKVPTLFEEAKILVKRLDLFKQAVHKDKDFKEYFNGAQVESLKIDENGKITTEKIPLDFTNQGHLEYAFNNLLGDELRELFNRLAYLDVVVKEIRNINTKETLDTVFSELFYFSPAVKVHLRDIFSLSNEIMSWINELNEVDPFLLKN